MFANTATYSDLRVWIATLFGSGYAGLGKVCSRGAGISMRCVPISDAAELETNGVGDFTRENPEACEYWRRLVCPKYVAVFANVST